ncbi:MAG: HEAT repeat domain-containing protein [Myxococcota bacterium]
MTSARSRALGLALLVAALPASARAAQPATRAGERPAQSLLDRVGISRVEQALRSTDANERERALSRLGTFGTARSLELLVRALDANGAAQSSRERLIAVRTLAPNVRVTAVRECLVRVMTGISAGAERAEPLQGLLRDTAALALAASGDASALEALGKALRQPGRVAQAAASALAAHPPENLSALARAHYAPTLDLVRAFEELGDERAFELLRDVVRRALPELQAAAAIALTRLGNFETVPLAERWAESQNATLRLAAAEIMVLARDARASKLLTRLLQEPERRTDVLALLHGVRDTSLEPALLAALAASDPSEKPAAIAALAASASDRGLAELKKLIANPELGDAAAYALSTSPARRANEVLLELLTDPASRLRAARAATLRAFRSGDTPKPLLTMLERLAAANSAEERAAGAYGLSLLQKQRCLAFLSSQDPVLVQAAARAAPFVGAAREGADRLMREAPGPTRTQLALVLVDAEARSRVPLRTLLSLLEEGGAAAPLALFALGSRDQVDTRARLLEFATAPDPVLRSALALGLGESPSKTARSLLSSAYRFEADADVRHAQVLALGRRREASRGSTLELAARLDPDARVRETARLGLSGVRSAAFSLGRGTLWMSVNAPDGERVPVSYVGVPAGLALPVVAAPDGALVLAGLPEGKVWLRLALEPRERKARGEDR